MGEAAYRYARTPGMETVDEYAEEYGEYQDPNASYEGYQDPNASYEGDTSYEEGYADPNTSYEGNENSYYEDPDASYEGYQIPEGWETHYDDAGTPYYYNP